MKLKASIAYIFAIILVSLLLILIGFKRLNLSNPYDVYQIYLNGEKIGVIENDEELLKLIDDTQNDIKEKFNVDKVYPPAGLEIVEFKTYKNNIKSAQAIYDIIKKKSTFTIKGYVMTLKPEEQDPIYINILNKEDAEPALFSAVSAFIPTEKLNNYINDTQVEITDVGKTIENVYFEEKITIKESYIDVKETIITNKDELTQYLLFGTLEKQATYIVKDGDTVEKIAYNNKLSNEELLIANPSLPSVNSLLSKGQKLNIGLIDPLFTIVEVSEVVEDIEVAYNTIYENDSTKYASQSYVKQEGKNGINRVTEKVLYKNGEIMTLVVSENQDVVAPINKVVVRGTRPSPNYGMNYAPPVANGSDWIWPTAVPYVITSYYGYRWGKLHGGLDISGAGFGTPIYAATEGTVVYTNSSCPNNGYYGSPCGGGYGNAVNIKTPDGKTIIYSHIKNNITVKRGDYVTKGQIIGYMGNSGSSTGTHLHFEIQSPTGGKLNPCQVAFAC